MSNKYAIFKIKFFQDNNNQEQIIVCIDTKLDTNFINKFLLFKSNLYKRLDIVLLVIVQNIVNQKIINKQIHLSINVIEANKIILETCSYIIKDIKVNIILDNNILEISLNKISLYLYSKQMQINCIWISIKFILLKVLLINFYIIFIIVSIALKLYLKTI